MFSDQNSDHTFHIFWLCTWLIFCFFLYVAIVHLLKIWEGVVIYCNLIPYLIESTLAIILFTTQYRTKFEIILREVFQKYHRVIRQTTSLYLDCFIATASRVFSDRV